MKRGVVQVPVAPGRMVFAARRLAQAAARARDQVETARVLCERAVGPLSSVAGAGSRAARLSEERLAGRRRELVGELQIILGALDDGAQALFAALRAAEQAADYLLSCGLAPVTAADIAAKKAALMEGGR